VLGLAFLLLVKRGLRITPNVLIEFREPEREAVDMVFKQLRNSMNELGKAWCFLDQVRNHEVLHPF
jgi:hypothetical protein